MRTLLVDDEKWMLRQLAEECDGIDDIQIVGQFDFPDDALAFAKNNRVDLAFLDIEMPVMNGIELAKRLRDLYPEVIIIFVSAYDKYMADAFKIQADYFLTKPCTHEEILSVLERARLLSRRLYKKVYIRTFGRFEVFVNDEPVVFTSAKAKELLALLVDKRGGILDSEEAFYAMWEGKPYDNTQAAAYRRALRKLKDTLAKYGVENIMLDLPHGKALKMDAVDCDYFQFLDGDINAMRLFNGAYMSDYSWGECSIADLEEKTSLLKAGAAEFSNNDIPCACIRCLNDAELTLVYMNEAFFAITGYSRENIADEFHNSLRALVADQNVELFSSEMSRMRCGSIKELEFRLKTRAGDPIWVVCRGELISRESGSSEIVCAIVDISAYKTHGTVIKQKVERDTLTGLYNRATGKAMIDAYLRDNGDEKGSAMILMGIDDFKKINDAYGRLFSDTVVVAISNVLKRAFRTSDLLARVGGGEMLVFAKDVPSQAFIKNKLAQIQSSIAEEARIKKDGMTITCSLGAAYYPDDGDSFDSIYARAVEALRKSKNEGQGQDRTRTGQDRTGQDRTGQDRTGQDRTGHPRRGDGKRRWRKRRHRIGSELAGGKFLEYAFAQLIDSNDLFASINLLMAITGRQLDISRVYIFENASDEDYIVNTFEWCAAGVTSEIDHLQKLSRPQLQCYYDNVRISDGLFYCRDVKKLDGSLRSILEPQGIKSMLHCALDDAGEFFGFMGFDECRETCYWSGQQVKALADLSKVVALFLRKYRLKHGNTFKDLQCREYKK